MLMRRSTAVLFAMLLGLGTVSARAQVVEAATARRITFSAGGMASAFQTDFAGNWNAQALPVASASSFPLFGVGAYADLKLSRWVQLKGKRAGCASTNCKA